MTTTTFDTLGYFEKLTAADVPAKQAKAQAEAMREIIEEKLATKRDLKELEIAVKRDMQEMELRMNARLDTTIKELELRITTRFGAMLAAAVAILAALIVLIK